MKNYNQNICNKTVEIVVVGSINLDITSYLTCFPEINQTVMASDSVQSMGGKGLNQAIAAACDGANVSFVGCIGEDQFGDRALEYLKSNNINTNHVRRVSGKSTGTASILVTEKGENMIAVASGANGDLMPEDIYLAKNLISQADVLIVQLEVPKETVKTALSLAKKYQVLSIFNPAPAVDFAKEFFYLADIVTPNETETAMLTGVSPLSDNGPSVPAKIMMAGGVKQVVITLGGEGCFIQSSTVSELLAPFDVDMVDPTGAGDVFNGVLAVGLGSGLSLKDAAIRASAAAALSVTKSMAEGAAPRTSAIDHFLNKNSQKLDI
jgi:ribokinase